MMPFGLQTGTASLVATGNNVAQLGMKVQGNSATVESFSVSGGPTLTITSNKDINKQLYQLIQITGQPSVAANPVGISLWANGTIATADDPANLNFVFQGAALGHLTIAVYSGNTQISSQTLTITSPPANYVAPAASVTNNTAALTSGTQTTLDFATQSGGTPSTTLDLTTSANVPSGPVYVNQYTQPPTGSSAPVSTSTSTYSALGKYITISAPYMEGNVSSVNITMSYTTTDLHNAGVTDESTLRIMYDDPVNGWTVVTPGGDDPVNHFVWGLTNHLSIYGVIAVTSSSGGGGAAVAVAVAAVLSPVLSHLLYPHQSSSPGCLPLHRLSPR